MVEVRSIAFDSSVLASSWLDGVVVVVVVVLGVSC